MTQILQAVERGDENSSERLLPLVYEQLRRLAAARMVNEPSNHTLQPTALVHEAWMRLMRGEPGNWTGRGHFFGAAAEAMRRILIERARRKAQIKRGAGAERVDISQVDLIATESDGSLLEVNDSLDRLEKQDPDKARVVMLKFFAGLTNQEVAESLGVTERTVERQWAFAKSWLTVDMREARR